MIEIFKNYALKIGNKRAALIAQFLLPMIEGSGEIIDVGCGPAHLSYRISKLTNRKIKYLDIKKITFTHPDVSVEIYDGEKLPYDESTFETCLCLFVLHHTGDPINILREMKRVSYRNIIVAEDYLSSRKYIFCEVIKDLISNFLNTKITFQYHTEDEWENMFKELELKIIKKIHFKTIQNVKMKHIAWLLEV